MSYGTKFYTYIKDSLNNLYTVNLNKLNYTGSSYYITDYSLSPLTLEYKDVGRDEDEPTLHGSSAKFSFYSKTTDNNIFDDIFDSEYKDYQLQIRSGTGGTSTIYWTGWVQPDELTKSFVDNAYFINVNANDGLGDLQDVPFRYNVYDTTGTTSMIYLLKKCLDSTGNVLDIESQVNITNYALSSGTTKTLFDNTFASSNRFIEIDSGRLKQKSCKDAIEYMLNPFYAKVIQSKGKWKITTVNEVDSPIVNYNKNGIFRRSTTGKTTSHYDKLQIINPEIIFQSDELSRVRPQKTLELTFNNKNAGEFVEDSSINGLFLYNIVGWTTDGENAYYSIDWDTGLTINNHAGMIKCFFFVPSYSHEQIPRYIYSYPINLYDYYGSTINVSVNTYLDPNITWSGGNTTFIPPKFHVDLIYAEDYINQSGLHFRDSVEKDLIPGELMTHVVNLKYTNSGQHFLRFYTIPQPNSMISSYNVYHNGITVFINRDASDAFDKLYDTEIVNTTAIKTTTQDIHFGDSTGTFDEGALRYKPSGNTYNWSAYGSSSAWTNDATYPFTITGATPYVTLPGLFTSPIGAKTSSLIRAVNAYLKGTTYTVPYDVNITGSGHSALKLEFFSGSTSCGYQQHDTSSLSHVISAFTITLTNTANTVKLSVINGDTSIKKFTINSIDLKFDSITNYSLQELSAYIRLKQYQKFKNYVRFSIKDSTGIAFNNIVSIQGKTYYMMGYSNDLKNNTIQLSLMELLTNPVDITVEEIPLTTSDGREVINS